MRQKVYGIKECYWTAVVLFTVMSLTFVAMPIANYVDENQQRIILIVIGILFWGSLAGGYVFLIKAYKRYKESFQKEQPEIGKKRKRSGFFKIYTNRAAGIMDTMLIVDLVIIVVTAISDNMNGIFPYIVLAIFIYSIHMHCMFNGNIYNDTISVKKENEK